MTRLHYVKKARTTKRGTGIKKGMPYYWWQFAFGKKQYSLTKPRRSQLTRSAFLGSMMDLEDRYNAITGGGNWDGVKEELDSIREEVDELKEELLGSISNMEAAFPNGCPTLDQLNERVEFLEEISQQLETAADKVLGREDTDEEDEEVTDETFDHSQVSWEYS